MNRWTLVAVVAIIVVAFAGYLTLSRSNEPPTGMNDGFEDFKVEEFEAVDQAPETDVEDGADADADAGMDTDVYDMTDNGDGAALTPPVDAGETNDPIPTVDDEDDAGVTYDPETETPEPSPVEEEGSEP